MLFYEIRLRSSGNALPEPIFRTETGAQEWLDSQRRQAQAVHGVPFVGAAMESVIPILEDMYVAPAADVVTDADPDTPVGVVAEAMRQMWNRDSAGIGIIMRARQIVNALEKAGHL